MEKLSSTNFQLGTSKLSQSFQKIFKTFDNRNRNRPSNRSRLLQAANLLPDWQSVIAKSNGDGLRCLVNIQYLQYLILFSKRCLPYCLPYRFVYSNKVCSTNEQER